MSSALDMVGSSLEWDPTLNENLGPLHAAWRVRTLETFLGFLSQVFRILVVFINPFCLCFPYLSHLVPIGRAQNNLTERATAMKTDNEMLKAEGK